MLFSGLLSEVAQNNRNNARAGQTRDKRGLCAGIGRTVSHPIARDRAHGQRAGVRAAGVFHRTYNPLHIFVYINL